MLLIPPAFREVTCVLIYGTFPFVMYERADLDSVCRRRGVGRSQDPQGISAFAVEVVVVVICAYQQPQRTPRTNGRTKIKKTEVPAEPYVSVYILEYVFVCQYMHNKSFDSDDDDDMG